MEIFTDKDGEVVFKKYSPVGELGELAAQMCETMNKVTGCIAAISDRDSIISVYGAPRRELGEKRISSELEQIIDERAPYHKKSGERGFSAVEGSAYDVAAAVPILSGGDIMGSVLFLTGEEPAKIGESEHKLAQLAARFLGRQLEA